MGGDKECAPVQRHVDLSKVAAGHIDLTAAERPGDLTDLLPRSVDQGLITGGNLSASDVLEDPHSSEHGAVGLAFEVDGLSARANLGGLLDDGDFEAVALKPEGEGGSGDARTGDQNRAGPGG